MRARVPPFLLLGFEPPVMIGGPLTTCHIVPQYDVYEHQGMYVDYAHADSKINEVDINVTNRKRVLRNVQIPSPAYFYINYKILLFELMFTDRSYQIMS